MRAARQKCPTITAAVVANLIFGPLLGFRLAVAHHLPGFWDRDEAPDANSKLV